MNQTQEFLFETASERELFLRKLQLIGCSKVAVEFSGSGDSGQINGVAFYDANDNLFTPDPSHTITFQLPESTFNHVTQQWESKVNTHDLPLSEAIEKVADKALDATGLDWWNNEGGQGYVYFHVSNGRLDIEVEIGLNQTVVDTSTFNY
jgi:hypothetical protein